VYLALVLGVMACVAGCREARSSSQPTAPIVATAGEVTIRADVFRQAYVEYLGRTGLTDASTLRRAFLDNLVAAHLLIKETRAAGVEQEAGYQAHYERASRKLLLDAYTAQVLFDTIRVTDRDLRAMFVRAHTQITARHLYARTREQADVLHARLQHGESFEVLAKEVFADPRLAENGGLVGTFAFDEMDPTFEDAAFSLEVGAISEPVRMAQGYSIIQVQDRFTDPLLTETEYAQKKSRFIPYVRQRKQQRAMRQHMQDLRRDLAIMLHEDAFANLLGQVTGQALMPEGEAFDAWLAAPLVTFGKTNNRRTWTVHDFRERAQYTDEQQRAQVRSRADLIDFVDGLVLREVMMDRAHEMVLDRTATFEHALTEAMDDWVLQTARERLSAEVEVPEDSAQAYFDTAPESEFRVPEKRQVWELTVETKADANALKKQAAHADFASLARAYSISPDARTTGGDMGLVSRDQLGALADLVFDAPDEVVLGPFEVQGQYVLFHTGRRQAARDMTFAEAQAAIREQLRYHFTRAHLRDTYAAVRARYPVEVDSDLLFSMPLTEETTN